MNFLSDFGKQMRDMFMSLTPAARIVAGVLVAAILVSTAYLFNGTRQVTGDYLFSGQVYSQNDIVKMEVAFSKAGLSKYEVVGNRVKVPTSERDKYIKALSDANALPQKPGLAMDESSGFPSLEPADQRKQKEIEKKQKQIESWIQQMGDISWANVAYSEQRQGFGRQMLQTASVALEPTSSIPIADDRLREIAKMVANSWAGLKPENVRVMDISSGKSTSPSDGTIGGDEDPYLRQQQAFEEKYRRRIRDLLEPYGDIRLEVGVILDDTMLSETQQLKYDTQPTTIEMNATRKDSESSKASEGGRPGTEPNALGNKAVSLAGGGDQSSKTKETSENEKRVVGQELTRTQRAGLVPKRVSASIGLPENYVRKQLFSKWMLANPGKLESEMPALTQADIDTMFKELERNIKTSVATILPPVDAGDDRFELVTVYPYLDLPAELPPSPSLFSQFIEWLQDSWQTLALLAVVMVAMGMVVQLSKTKGTAADDPFKDGFGIALVEKIKDNLDISGEDDAGGEEVVGPDGKIVRKVEVTGQELKESLSTMIQDNPDAAVNLIRTWIGEAA